MPDPDVPRYQSALLKNVDSVAGAFPIDKAEKLNARNLKIIEEIAERTSAIEKGVEELVKLELIVDDSLWPLPKYRELLFIR